MAMVVLDDNDLAVLLMVSYQVLMEALLKISASQGEILVSPRLEVRQ